MNDEWANSTLGEVAEVCGGGTPSTKEPSYWGGDVLWLTPTEVVKADGRRIATSERTITREGLEGSSAKLLPAGTVLLTTRASVGFTAIAEVPLATNQGFQSLIPGSDILPEFLMYWIQGNRDEFTRRAGGSTFPEVSKSKVSAIPIAYPPLPVQRRIVDLMAHLDRHLANLRSEMQAVDRLLAAHQMALRESVASLDSQRLGDIAECSWGNTSLTKSAYSDKGDVAYSASGPDGFVESGEMSGEAVVLSAIGAKCGGTWLATGHWTAIKNTIWFRSASDDVRTDFLYWVTRDPGTFAKRGQAQPFISLGDVRALELGIPSLEQQDAWVDLLNGLAVHSNHLSGELDATSRMRLACLSGLLSGSRIIPSSYDSLLDSVA